MRLRSRLIFWITLFVIISPLVNFTPSIRLAHAQGTMIQLGQPVTGTLSQQNPEDWWGVNFPRGQINITLTIPKGNTADLAFAFSPFQAGTPLGENYPSLANVIHNPGSSNQTYKFTAPGTDFLLNFPFLIPGPTAIRVYSPSSNYGKTGSVVYTLTVVQLQQFTTIINGYHNSFNNVISGTPLLYSFAAPTTGAYNITMRGNATGSSLTFSMTTFENDFYLPMSIDDLPIGQNNMLIVLSSTATTYLIITPNGHPSPSASPFKGNVTVTYQSLTTISPGQQITGSSTGFTPQPTFYLSNLPVGSYYNITLTPAPAVTGRLGVFSPSWVGDYPNVGLSASPGVGVVQKIRNLALFYLTSFSFTNSSGYQTYGPAIPGHRPDKVLVSVLAAGTGSYTLRIDAVPFPQLNPNTMVNLNFSTTKGPFYSFYQVQPGPGSYTESLPYAVRNSTVNWSSEIDLDGAIQMLGTFDPSLFLRSYTNFLFGPTSRPQVQGWQAINERNFINNNNFSHQNATIQLGYATVLPATPIVGAAIGPIFYGDSTIKSNLSYTFKASTGTTTVTPISDFLSGLNTNLYSISLTAGTTYRLDDTHTSADETWALYDPATGLTVPTLGPFLAPGVSTDPNQALTSDYLFFTAPATGTYYLAAGINPGPVIPGPNPAGLPEEHYTFTVTVSSSPPSSPTHLTVTLSAPSSATAGQAIKINGTVTNTGSNNANNVIVTITLPGELSTTQSLSIVIGTLTPSQASSFSWAVTTSGSGTVTATVVTSSDNAPQNVKTSSISITGTQPGSSATSILSSPIDVGIITGVLAAIVALALGFVIGRKRKRLATGSPTGPST